MRCDFKDGSWADIADVSELRHGDRKAVNAAIVLHVDEDNRPVFPGDLEDNMLAALYRRVVRNWSLPFPVPSQDPASVDKMPLEFADQLAEAVAPHMALCKGTVNPEKKGTDPTSGSAS